MNSEPNYDAPHRSGLLPAVIAGATLVLAGAVVFLFFQIDGLRKELTAMRSTMNAEVGSIRDSSSVTSAAQMRHIESLKKQLEDAQVQARSLSSQAKAEGIAKAEQIQKQLQAEQAKMQQQVSSEISGVRQSAETANAKLADVSTDVGSVKTQVASTTAELQKTIADLKSVRGDLGVQSGLIATNHDELAALRRLGERNYFEFTIKKSKERQRVGDISVQLKKTDPKKNKYTVEVLADDKLTEKKDKNINEPVQFYTSKARIPYELVVNRVDKDVIVGYLSTPKEQSAR